jgi:hypothetical protein
MAGMTHSYGKVGLPNWYGEGYDSSQLIPGGAIFEKTLISPGADGKRRLSAGVLLGRTQAEADTGAKFGLFVAGDTDTYLTLFEVEDLDFNAEITLVRPQTIIKANWLPGWAGTAAAVKAEIQRRYQCILGAPSA